MVVGPKAHEKPKGRMYVRKRGGRTEPVHFDKITSRIQKLCYGLNMEFVDPAEITLQVINGLYTGVTTVELDNLAAETAATLTIQHPDYAILAARIAVSNLHKETKKQFSDVIVDLYEAVDDKTGEKAAMISDQHYEIIISNADRLNSSIIYDRDFYYNYFGFKTLESCYLMRIKGRVVERPQHMLMRVAVGIHGADIEAAIETYNLMSEKYFAHSEVVLNAAATPRQQLSSCYLLAMKDDSIEGIYDTLKECALVTKSVANIGMHIHCIRAHGTYIAGTNGTSNGIVPMLRVFNNVVRHVFQGANKRQGEVTIYLEPWHCDVFELLELPKSTGKEEVRARDLSYALWVPDLFMQRVESGGLWSLMCPHDCPGLFNTWGDEFNRIYCKYELEGRFAKQVDAQSLWSAILDTQVQTGMPFMLYKDSCNRKSNQQNLGTVKCSNYTAENITYTSPDEVAVLNEASIAVNMFVKSDRSYDFWKLKEVTKVITNNLNKIIDINNYPVPEAHRSSHRHRPISIGVQGLADLFIALRLPFESASAQHLNKQIFETIYYGALEASCELSERDGMYDTYPGSPASKGVLQYDMWEATPAASLWNWEDLKRRIAEHGLRNSLLMAPMPTDATAQILGNAASFEPYSSYVQTCSVTSGDFTVVNHHLLRDLVECGLWDQAVKSQLINNCGSVQNIPELPEDVKNLYKTVWETSQKVIITMAADRGAFIDQSQSLNIHIAEPSYAKLTSMHFHAWKAGLKTGMHYLRTKPVVKAIQLTLNPIKQKKTNVLEIARNVNTSNGTAKDSNDEQLRSEATGLLTGEQLIVA